MGCRSTNGIRSLSGWLPSSSSKCRRQAGRASPSVWQQLSLWFEPVVHACSTCTACGVQHGGDPFNPCASACGAEIYDRDLESADDVVGIMNGAPVCLDGPKDQCPGWIPTVACHCPPPTDPPPSE